MLALRMTAWHEEAELRRVDEPVPLPGEVVVRIGGSGACHSDLQMMHGADRASPFELPFTLGHENAGWVHAVGAGVTAVEVGQPVAVYGAWGCGSCGRCAVGMDNYCEGTGGLGTGAGLGVDGGMAELLLVPHARHLVPLPDGMTPVQAAPLLDAGLTPYHAVRRSLHKLGPTATAVVIGVGGLGHLAVQILKATSAARVIAIDTRAEARTLATSCGADVVLDVDENTVRDVRRATGRHGADVVLDVVGTEQSLRMAAACTRSLGDLTLVGVGLGTFPFGFLTQPYEVSLQSVYWGSRPELGEVLDLANRGLLTPSTVTYPLERALDAYRDLDSGRLAGRAVIVPNAS